MPFPRGRGEEKVGNIFQLRGWDDPLENALTDLQAGVIVEPQSPLEMLRDLETIRDNLHVDGDNLAGFIYNTDGAGTDPVPNEDLDARLVRYTDDSLGTSPQFSSTANPIQDLRDAIDAAGTYSGNNVLTDPAADVIQWAANNGTF